MICAQVYLFLKPLLNCLENCCCPRSSEDAEPLVMHANPAFGLDLEASQARAAARAPRRRSTIDKMLMRARHLRKKKTVGDADPAATPAPLRTAAPVTTEQPTRRRSAVAALARDAETELSLIHISEPTRLGMISYAVFCLKKKNK